MCDMPESPVHLSWEAYEHEHIERSSEWFWALGIIAVCAAITSILFGNILFAILIAIASTTIGLIASRPPLLHQFEITERGVRTGPTLHPYNTILAFWVDEELPEPLLLIDTTRPLSPNLVIPLGDLEPEHVREVLSHYAEEHPMKEPLSHKILEFFGF